MNKIFGIKYRQEGQQYISMVLPMKYIIENSTVLIYGEDEEYGYQRAPKKSHYAKIAKDKGFCGSDQEMRGQSCQESRAGEFLCQCHNHAS